MSFEIAKNIIAKLPLDVTRYMYDNYLKFDAEKKPLCDAFLEWLNTDVHLRRLKFSINGIKDKIEQLALLLKCPDCVSYLCEKDTSFCSGYEYVIIDKKHENKNISRVEFCMFCIIMFKYH